MRDWLLSLVRTHKDMIGFLYLFHFKKKAYVYLGNETSIFV